MPIEHRSAARDTSHTFRMSAEDKALMKRTAAEAGLTIQQLFERRMFGAERPTPREGRPRKYDQNEELPLGKSA